MRESYAIGFYTNLLPRGFMCGVTPREEVLEYLKGMDRIILTAEYLPGFNTKLEAKVHLTAMYKDPYLEYTVVYVREYFNKAADKDGNFTISTIEEIVEPGA